jgi:hypothetical protein
MNSYYRPFFAFALAFFAVALKVLTEKAGRPKIEEFQASTAGRSLESNTPMAKNNSDEPRTLGIRKYQNRRYYDSTRSRQQIHKLIIEAYNIRVLDAKTNEDITPKVLLEYEPVKLDMFPNELLTRISWTFTSGRRSRRSADRKSRSI